MCNIDYHIKLDNIIKEGNSVEFLSEAIELDNTGNIETNTSEIGIVVELFTGNRVRLLNHSIETQVFESVDKFREIQHITADSNFLVYDGQDVYSYIKGITYLNFSESQICLFSNIKFYLDFLILLKSQESELDGTFHFVDSFNLDHRKIVFLSISDKGRVTIKYTIKCPIFDNSIDYSIGYNKFVTCFTDTNKTILKFLKSTTINTIVNFDQVNRIKLFYENLSNIVDKAQMNYEVFLNELSVEKIKKDYDEVKSKYFTSLSDILSKLSQNIIALPIAIAGLLFAIEKLKEIQLYLYMLVPILFISSIYISALLKVYYKDLIYIGKIFDFDFNLLVQNNFFTKYPEELDLFNDIKNRIEDRIMFLKRIIGSYFWILNVSNLVIVGIILHYLNINLDSIILVFLFLLIVVVLVRNNIMVSTNSNC